VNSQLYLCDNFPRESLHLVVADIRSKLYSTKYDMECFRFVSNFLFNKTDLQKDFSFVFTSLISPFLSIISQPESNFL